MATRTTGPTRERVVLVDENDLPTGEAEKLQAHVDGSRHRAFSIFVFGDDGRLLLQRRSLGKYHSGGLWANTCCGHPRPGEDTSVAAARRLEEELSLTCPLTKLMVTSYRVVVSNGLIENELNHVFIGHSDATPVPDPAEVMEVQWVEPRRILRDMEAAPGHYAEWLKVTLPQTLARLSDRGVIRGLK